MLQLHTVRKARHQRLRCSVYWICNFIQPMLRTDHRKHTCCSSTTVCKARHGRLRCSLARISGFIQQMLRAA